MMTISSNKKCFPLFRGKLHITTYLYIKISSNEFMEEIIKDILKQEGITHWGIPENTSLGKTVFSFEIDSIKKAENILKWDGEADGGIEVFADIIIYYKSPKFPFIQRELSLFDFYYCNKKHYIWKFRYNDRFKGKTNFDTYQNALRYYKKMKRRILL